MERSKKKRLSGLFAWLVSFALAISMVSVPMKAEAADGDVVNVADATNTSNPVYVEFKAESTIPAGTWGGNSPAVDLTQYTVTIYNNSASMISDWAVTINSSDASTYNSGWNGVTQSGNTITIGTCKTTDAQGNVWSNAEIEAGSSVSGPGFQVAASAIENATITMTYKVGASSGGVSQDDTATDPSQIGSTSSDVTATCTQYSVDGEYHEYILQVNNNSSESIGDWIVAIPMTGISKTQDWSSWAKVQAYYTSEYLYIVPVSGAVISAGASFGSTTDDSYKFNYTGSSNISSTVVYYKTGTTSSGAFDAVVNNSSGGSSTSGGGGSSGGGTFDGSNIGSIDTSLDYNFAKLLQYSLYFYDANMCGDKVSETSLYSKDLYNGWRGDCHVNDSFRYKGTTYSAVGGYHDAGDHVKFGLPMSEAMTALGISYYEFGQAFDELGQKQHLKTIVDYYCTYVKSCTVLNAAGTEAEAFCYQVGCGQKDHESWCAPEVENESATERTYTLIATSSNPATDIVGGTVAALTLNYLNFGNEEDLKYAKALFAFAKNNSKARGAGDTSGNFYYSNYGSWEDEYCLAAALLYKVTGDTTYKTEYNNNNRNSGNIEKPFGWENVYQAAAFYAPEKSSSEISTINSWFASVANANTDKYYCGDSWGSARVNCNVQLMMLVYDKQNGTNTYSEWCKYQMSTILGNNSTGKNLVCGYNTNSPTKPHHRAASGYSGWTEFNNNATQKYTLYGALAGGPTSSDFSTYNDKVNDATSNEVTLDYNAGLVGAAAALYLLYKDSTEDGFKNQKINADFYGGANFSGGTTDPTVAVTGVTLNEATKTLNVGDDFTLIATVAPDDATKKKVTWTSSDETVATVVDGVVTAVAAGSSTITVTTADGGFTDTCEVTVQNVPAAKLSASPVALEISSLEYGYSTTRSGSVTISNEGDADTVSVSAALEKGTSSNFEITENLSGNISKGDSATIKVAAKTGLAADSYTDNLIITYNTNKKLTIPVSVTVTKRAITVKAEDKSKTYGEANPELTYKVTSGSVLSTDTLNVTLETTAEKTSDAGTYDITVALGSNPNYDITAQKGTLTVKQKTVTSVTFPTATDITVGDSLADATLSGGDTTYGVFAWKEPTVQPERGTYDGDVVLTLSAQAKKNYSFTDVTGYNATAGTITQTVSVNVKRAGLPEITFPTASDLKFGQKLSESTLKGGSTEYGSFKWADGTVRMTATEVANGSNAYDVVFTWNDDCKTQYGILDTDEDATLTKKVTVKVGKADTTESPDKAVLQSRTSASITVQSATGYEYSKDGETWQDSNVFESLSPFTLYQIYTRIKETDTHKASVVSEPYAVYTLVTDPYTIDLSKLATDASADYVDALRTEDGTSTVVYTDDVLALLDTTKPYTITGSNSNITVKTAEGFAQTITLDNAQLKKLEIANTSEVTIATVGTSAVTGTISASKDIKLSGTGILNAGTISVDNGTVTITGGTVNASEITAKNVTITAGSVTVTGDIAASTDVEISGGIVSVTGDITASNDVAISGGTVETDGITADGDVSIGGGTVTVDQTVTAGNDIKVTGGNVTANGGLQATGNVEISGADTVVTATGKDETAEEPGTAAIAGSEITITDATVTATGGAGAPGIESSGDLTITGADVTATGGAGASAIESSGNITMENANVIVNTEGDGTKAAISVGEGTIQIDGGTVTGNNSNMYSKPPVDKDGNTVVTVTVTFTDAEGKTLKTINLNKGNNLTLADTEILTSDGTNFAASKPGHELSWDCDGTAYDVDAVISNVQENMTLQAVWTYITYPIADAVVSDIAAQTYTGAEITPAVTVTYKGNALLKGTHYTVTYSNNTNVGTAKVTITGMGPYVGCVEKTFTIAPKDISSMDAKLADTRYPYTGSAITPDVVLKDGATTLVRDAGYTATYTDNVNVGTATVVIAGKGNYTGQQTLQFTIYEVKTSVNLEDVEISEIADQVYTGSPLTPKPVLTYKGAVLSEGTDYTLTYTNNINIGEATIKISGLGTYVGETDESFDIIIRKGLKYTMGNYQYQITNARTDGKGTVQLVKCVKKAKTVNIAATVNIGGVNFRITDIKANAFKNNKTMTKLTIGKYVTSIGSKAFYGCTKLKTATIGKGVKSIGKQAFYNCKAMQTLTISTTLLKTSKVGSKAFTKMGAGNYKKLVVKVPKKKLSAYKNMLKAKGLSTKARVK